jgi:hypothetical protein
MTSIFRIEDQPRKNLACSRWLGRIPLKCQFIYGLYGAISQKMTTFITTVVRTSKKKLNSMVRVRERTIPTERPPLVGEVIATWSA